MNTEPKLPAIKSIASGLYAIFCITLFSLNAMAADEWVEQKAPALNPKVQADGDSFGMTVASPKNKRVRRTYRLYGADCPESDGNDARVAERIKEQAAHFGCAAADIPAWGKKASEFTHKLLTEGAPKVYTLGYMGTKALGGKGDPQRYYSMVEVTAPDGKRRMLHELLVEEGLARAFGMVAPWSAQDLKHLGKEKTEERFRRELDQLENKAKREKKGVWSGKAP